MTPAARVAGRRRLKAERRGLTTSRRRFLRFGAARQDSRVSYGKRPRSRSVIGCVDADAVWPSFGSPQRSSIVSRRE